MVEIICIFIYLFWWSYWKREIDLLKNSSDEIIAYRAVGLHHKNEGPANREERVCDSFGCRNQVVGKENQWLETDYNYGDAFDMNYFTAPYNGLYQFYANIKLYQDNTSVINMNSSIDLTL